MKQAVLIGTILATSLLFTQNAHAQCGSGLGISICGQIYVNTPTITPPVVVQRPAVVVQTPPVYTPPPVVYTPPPQPVVVQQPVVVEQPAPVVVQTQVVRPAPRLVLRRPFRDFVRHRGLGFGVRAGAGYAGVEEITNFGGGAVLRYIASPRFGVEMTVDAYGGNGYTGDVTRTEIPVTLNGLWFVNPRNRVQLYLLAGVGASFGFVEADNGDTDEPTYIGGELGVGVEFLIGNHIGLTLDARGFLRGRVTDRMAEPDSPVNDGSCRTGAGGEWECTDLESGITFNAGFNFYL